jgi:hypothetical protein
MSIHKRVIIFSDKGLELCLGEREREGEKEKRRGRRKKEGERDCFLFKSQ